MGPSSVACRTLPPLEPALWRGQANRGIKAMGNPGDGRLARPAIAVLVHDPVAGERVRAALSTLCTPWLADSPAAVLDVLMRHRVGAVMLDCDAPAAPTEALVRTIRLDFPYLPLLIYCELTAAHVKRIPALVHAGADEVVLRGVDDLRNVLRRILLDSSAVRATSQALEALREVIPEAIAPVLDYCLGHADRPLTVDQVARDLGIHRKTLCNRAAAAGVPAPSVLISWCRLLHAARLLDDSGRSVERIAHTLGFGSGTALRNMLRRYTGLRPRELPAHAAHRALLALLKQRIAAGPVAAG